jgi:hypothetical protein
MIEPFDGKDIQPYRVTALDIETAPNGDIIAIGFAYTTETGETIYEAFDTFDLWYASFRQLLIRYKKYRYFYGRISRVYAHNGAGFDYLSLYKELSERNLITDAQYFMADSAGLGLSCVLEGVFKVTFSDSYRLMPASLDSLSKTFGVQHIKQEVPDECKNNYLLFKEKYPSLFWSYLKHDVLGLQEVIYSFWMMVYTKFGNIGTLPMTLPSLALRVFSKQLNEPIMTPSNDELKTFERRAYNGGLTLCMRTGEVENINVYDVNSMYPFVMASEVYPYHYSGYWSRTFDADSCGIWECEFTQSDHSLPPILFDEQKGASYNGTGVYTTNEINYGRSIGITFNISRGYVYRRTSPIFERFITTVYRDRKDAIKRGDDGLAFTLKIMMNSLYGKFAQREEGYKIVFATGKEQRELLAQGIHYIPLGEFIAIPEKREVKHAFVAIAAMITANARINLHSRMVDAIRRGYELWYCDTDSIHAKNVTMDESDELGGVKLEYSDDAVYAGKKLYAFKNGKVKAKGIGRRTVGAKLTYDAIREIALNTDTKLSFTFEVFPSVKEVLRGDAKPAVMMKRTRRIRNTGGIWNE